MDNRNEVLKRQGKVEKRLKKKTKRFVQCDKKIKEQVEKGYLKEIGRVQDVNDDRFYIPVFPLIKENRETTKTRMVLDCAAKFNGVSLNDTINPGPKLITELFDVIMRFRRYTVAISGDISEMFMQIMLDPEYQNYYRIIWNGVSYQYTRTIFGDCSSPFKANKVLKSYAAHHQKSFPEVANTVMNAVYVDDALDSRCTVNETIQTRRELTQVLQLAGMKMRKWLSNDIQVISDIPIEDRAASVHLDQRELLPTRKSLGVMLVARFTSPE